MDYIGYKELIEKKLDEFLPIEYPSEIFESMKYSITNGGKRLRPVIVLEVARMLSGSFEDAIPSACAIEMLHCQSLIHDDLPCMDNDDFRRGKPTNHKVFSEAIAVLAGDALLSFAPDLIIKKSMNLSNETKLTVLSEFFKAAGVYGIIGGQVVDLQSEGKNVDEKTLRYIHNHKTSALFEASARIGAIVSGADEKTISKLTQFATLFGFAFQISDDILDKIGNLELLGKTPCKDEKVNKATSLSILGLEESKKQLHNCITKAINILQENNFESEVLKEIVLNVEKRIQL